MRLKTSNDIQTAAYNIASLATEYFSLPEDKEKFKAIHKNVNKILDCLYDEQIETKTITLDEHVKHILDGVSYQILVIIMCLTTDPELRSYLRKKL